jgi:Na+-driven multidrug efflux pump
MRVMQSLFLPAMAVAFATAPIVGQNLSAGRFARVREAFWRAALAGAVIMVLLTAFCQIGAGWAVRAFTTESTAAAVGAQFLKVVSWNFIASGFVFTASSFFQGMGNTVPALWSSATRLFSFMIPAFWLSARPDFQLLELWHVSVASMTLQAVVSFLLVRREFRTRLQGAPAAQARASLAPMSPHGGS